LVGLGILGDMVLHSANSRANEGVG
jgi:hypothetical protein